MCMCYCWACCLCFTTLNFIDCNHYSFCTRLLWLLIWGGLNFFFFSFIESGLCEGIEYLVSIFYISTIFKLVSWSLIVINLVKVLQNFNLDSFQELKTIYDLSSVIIISNFFVYPVLEDWLSASISLSPIVLQVYLYFLTPRNKDNVIGLLLFWVMFLNLEIIGLKTIWNFLCYLFVLFVTYFIEYPVICGLAFLIIYQMNIVIENIEEVKENFHMRGKTKRQLVGFFLKEIFNYFLLGFLFIVVYYCEIYLEFYHGYLPAIISFIAKSIYCFPVVALLSYPEYKNLNPLMSDQRRDSLNFIAVGFSIYLIMSFR